MSILRIRSRPVDSDFPCWLPCISNTGGGPCALGIVHKEIARDSLRYEHALRVCVRVLWVLLWKR